MSRDLSLAQRIAVDAILDLASDEVGCYGTLAEFFDNEGVRSLSDQERAVKDLMDELRDIGTRLEQSLRGPFREPGGDE